MSAFTIKSILYSRLFISYLKLNPFFKHITFQKQECIINSKEILLLIILVTLLKHCLASVILVVIEIHDQSFSIFTGKSIIYSLSYLFIFCIFENILVYFIKFFKSKKV